MSGQERKPRPGGVGIGEQEDEAPVRIDPGDSDDMQQKLKEAADKLAKKKVADELAAAQEKARKPKRAPCCCC